MGTLIPTAAKNAEWHGSSDRFPYLPTTASGWTDFSSVTASGYESARVLFVSDTNGNDTTGEAYSISDITFDADGMFQPNTTVNEYKTIAAAYAQMRDGFPDILLLNRGDSWEEAFDSADLGTWQKSGVDADNRMIMASYGSGNRPTMLIGALTGLTTYLADYLIFSGIRLYSQTWETVLPDRAIDVNGGAQKYHLYEDCVCERNICRVHGGFSDIEFRRNIFIEGQTDSLAAKVYAHDGDGLSMEENVFYSPEEGNRHFYFDPDEYSGDNDYTLTNVEIKKNTFYCSQRTGLSVRSGGLIDNNLILRNDVVLVGGHGGSEGSIQSATVINNTWMESLPDSVGDGEYGLWIKNNEDSIIANNIWTDPTGLGNYATCLRLTGGDTVGVARNIDIYENLVHDWSNEVESFALSIFDDLIDVSNVTIHDNDFQYPTKDSEVINHRTYDGGTKQFEGVSYYNNNYHSARVTTDWFTPGGALAGWVTESGETGASAVETTFTDPDRTISTYATSIGETMTTEQFMAAMIALSRADWDSNYTAEAVNGYIRAGFDKTYAEV